MPTFTKGDNRVLFIHIPKTAGSYVTDSFRCSGYTVKYDNRYEPRRAGTAPIPQQHYHAPLIEQTFNPKDFNLIFTIVRNPVSRFISEFFYRSHLHNLDNINDFVQSALSSFKENPYVWSNHIRPQHEFIPKSFPVQILKFETIAQSLPNFLPQDVSLLPNKVNQSTPKKNLFTPANPPLSNDSLRALATFYSQDFPLWNKAQ